MNKVKNKLLLMFLIIVWSMTGLVGCKNDESKSVEGQTDISDIKDKDAEKESESGKLSDYPEGTFDGKEVCKHIEINGKIVEFPWTLNKLGDEYEFEDVIINDNIYMAKLMYNGEYMFDVFGKGIDVNRESLIECFFWNLQNINICEIGYGDILSDIILKFGDPNSIRDNGLENIYTYINNEVQVSFYIEKKSNIINDLFISTIDKKS